MALYRGVEPIYSQHLFLDTLNSTSFNGPLGSVSEDLLHSVIKPGDTVVIVCGFFPQLPLLSNSVRIVKASVGMGIKPT